MNPKSDSQNKELGSHAVIPTLVDAIDLNGMLESNNDKGILFRSVLLASATGRFLFMLRSTMISYPFLDLFVD